MFQISGETHAKNCFYTIKVNKKVDKKNSSWIKIKNDIL